MLFQYWNMASHGLVHKQISKCQKSVEAVVGAHATSSGKLSRLSVGRRRAKVLTKKIKTQLDKLFMKS